MKKLFTVQLFAAAAFLASPALTMAQGITNSGGKISVASGTVLTINSGGFTNLTNGEVDNQGEIELDGDWTNNDAGGVFGASPTTGLVTLDGGGQTIGGTAQTNFYNLTAAGSGDKTLNVNTSVENVATLTTHEIILNSNDLTLENSSTGAITGSGGIVSETAPSSGYGRLVWNIGNSTGTYAIPFETSGGTAITFGYDVQNAGAGSTANAYKSFATYPTNDLNTNTGATWTDLPTGVQHLTDDFQDPSHWWVMDRFWVIDNDAQGNYTTYPQIEYDFVYDPNDILAPNHITEANLVAQRYNSGSNQWLDWLYSDPASGGSVTVDLANQEDFYAVWTLVDDSDPLPIELAQFDGDCDASSIEITWTTWTESKNDYFTLERSSNGEDFEIVDVIDGGGTTNEATTYSYTDLTPYAGTSYYRLKDTDIHGKSDYSDVIAVSCHSDGNDFALINAYDNDQDLVIEFTAGQNEPYDITLMDSRGRQLTARSNRAYDGYNKITLPTVDLARGIYVITLSNGTESFGKRVMLN